MATRIYYLLTTRNDENWKQNLINALSEKPIAYPPSGYKELLYLPYNAPNTERERIQASLAQQEKDQAEFQNHVASVIEHQCTLHADFFFGYKPWDIDKPVSPESPLIPKLHKALVDPFVAVCYRYGDYTAAVTNFFNFVFLKLPPKGDRSTKTWRTSV